MHCLARMMGRGRAPKTGTIRRRELSADRGPAASDAFSASHKSALCGIAAALVAAAGGTLARANDSMASLGAGGLTLVRSADVAMAAEELAIRPDAVEVRYRFVNRGPVDIDTLVAFPLPDVAAEYREDGGFGTRGDPVNFVGFRIRVDGRPVTPRGELRAFVAGREVTDLLGRYDVPVSLFDPRLEAALRRVPAAGRKALADAGAADFGAPTEPAPLWTMRTMFAWRQRFPAGRAVAVEHRYAPIAGAFLATAADLEQTFRDHAPCADADTRATVARMARASELVIVRRVDYILTTARNWHGPVGRFALTIDAGDPGVVTIACIEGIRRVSQSRLALERTDFAPTQELAALFVSAPQAAPAPGAALPGRYPFASQRALTEADLAGLDVAALRLMRNEVFARHGYVFRDEALRRHFAAQPWYQPRQGDVLARLSPIERANVRLLQERERSLAR